MNSISALRIGDIASRDVLTVPPQTELREVIHAFAAHRVSSIIITEGRAPIGIITERDLIRLANSGYGEESPVATVMSAPLRTARWDLDFASAHSLLSTHAIRHLVLTDAAGELAGVASETDFRRHIGGDLFASIQNLAAVMEPPPEMLSPAHSLAEVLEAMATRHLDHLLIGERGIAEGIITERDIPRLLAEQLNPATVCAGEVMSSPLQTIPLDTPVAAAAEEMAHRGLRHLVVVDRDGYSVGVISQHRMLERLSLTLMEEARQRLSLQLDVLLEMTGVGAWEFDHQRQQLTRSPSLNAVLGFQRSESVLDFAAVLERIAPADRPRIEQAFARLGADPLAQLSEEYRVPDAEQRERHFCARGRVIARGPAGEPLRSAGIAIDLADEPAHRAQLHAHAERLRQLLDHLPLAIADIDEEGQINFINQRFVTTFGYQLAELGHLARWWQLSHPQPEQRQQLIDRWDQACDLARQNRQPAPTGPLLLYDRSGTAHTLDISLIAQDNGFLATFSDLSAQHQQQQLLAYSNHILQAISQAAPLGEVLERLLRGIEALHPTVGAAIHLLDEYGQLQVQAAHPDLRPCLSTSPPPPSSEAACRNGQQQFVPALRDADAWPDAAARYTRQGWAATWSTPIRSAQGRILGCLDLFWRQPDPLRVEPLVSYHAAALALAALAIEHQQRDSDLLQLHNMLARAEEIGQVGSWSWDITARRPRWSTQMFRLFALDPAAEVPDLEQFIALTHPDDQGELRRVLERMLAGETPGVRAYRRHPSCGPLCYLQVNYDARRDDAGRVIGFDGTLVDVSSTIKSEDALRKQLIELRRWQRAMLGREGRVLELKREVNALLQQAGAPPRYSSVEENPA